MIYFVELLVVVGLCKVRIETDSLLLLIHFLVRYVSTSIHYP